MMKIFNTVTISYNITTMTFFKNNYKGGKQTIFRWSIFKAYMGTQNGLYIHGLQHQNCNVLIQQDTYILNLI